jgi:hypothetical protein
LIEALAAASASWDPITANLFGAATNGSPVSWAIFFATRVSNPAGAFSPVPTAVPPRASLYRSSRDRSRRAMSSSSIATYPENSWPRVRGTASCRCVRPILTIESQAFAFFSRSARMHLTAGISRFLKRRAVAMCIPAGNASLDDCDLFTSSFGWIGFLLPITPPASSIARLEMTSFTFMFDWVPLPVIQTWSGKLSSSFPAITSSAARAIRSAFSPGRVPSS